MTTNIAVAAQITHPTNPLVLKRTLPNESESRLEGGWLPSGELPEGAYPSVCRQGASGDCRNTRVLT